MTITSTKQARHKPAPKKRSIETKEEKDQILIIDSEPASSSDGPEWFYFWYKVPGQPKNANSKSKSISCLEHQVSWVKEAYANNTLLVKGKHFEGRYIDTIGPDAKCSTRWRYVLMGDWYIDEPVEEDISDDPPMHWQKPGNEIPPVVESHDDDQDPEPITDPIALETLRRYEIWNVCCQAVEIEPTEPQRCEAMRIFTSGTIIDSKKR